MISSLKPYPRMKDSGVPWLGDVPEHWEVRGLKWVAQLNPSKTEASTFLSSDSPVTFLPMERVGTNGKIDFGEPMEADKVWQGFTYFRKGDVIVAKITPCFENGKGACLDSMPTNVGFGSTEFHVLRAKGSISPQYLYRFTTLEKFRRLGADAMTGAAGQQRVPQSFIVNYKIGLSAVKRFLLLPLSRYSSRNYNSRFLHAQRPLVFGMTAGACFSCTLPADLLTDSGRLRFTPPAI
ncbi:MAG: hypothetical protein U9R40_06105 [Synergistota bacterium]|nr:hypothetical protein [Synergistota bacterium]